MRLKIMQGNRKFATMNEIINSEKFLFIKQNESETSTKQLRYRQYESILVHNNKKFIK